MAFNAETGLQVGDVDIAAEENGQGRNEIKDSSQTKPTIELGTQRTLQVSKELEDKWNEKNLKHGKKVYRCPLCKINERKDYDTKGEANEHIAKVHKAEVKLKKMEKKDKTEYTPYLYIISPERTVDDLMLPEQAKIAEEISRMRAAIKPAVQNLSLMMGNNKNDVGRILSMPEMLACGKIKDIDDKTLVEVFQQAKNRGRGLLMRRCRQEAAARNVPLIIM